MSPGEGGMIGSASSRFGRFMASSPVLPLSGSAGFQALRTLILEQLGSLNLVSRSVVPGLKPQEEPAIAWLP